MLTRRRVLLGLLALVLAAVAWTAWKTFQVQGDLREAQAAAAQLRATIERDNPARRQTALDDLQSSAADAATHSGGWWWGLLTHLPVVGDDARGIRALSSSIDTVATDGIQPLADAVDELDSLTSGDGVDLDAVRALQEPLQRSTEAFDRANREVDALDSSGYAGFLRPRFDDYVDQVAVLDRGVGRAASASQVLPTVFGGDGDRSYLLVFQNNAEIRATGGLPGSWSRVDASDGRLRITGQGSGAGFGRTPEPVLPLTEEEVAVYSDLLGTFFLDANFTPDFPRAADLMRARWEQEYAPDSLDGVITLDPVAMSYLLRGTGPVRVGKVRLTADNAVQQLLNEPYLSIEDNDEQDAFFAQAAQAVFEAATGDLASPINFIRGLSRAADEGRFHLESYDDAVADQLSDGVRGVLATDDGTSPHVEVGLNDATGSKMSYYLRYTARVTSSSCRSDSQQLTGTMSMKQSIPASEAAQLPDSITGLGQSGIERGYQAVNVRLYGPTGGTIDQLTIDGEMQSVQVQQLDGRPVATALVQVAGPDDVLLNWSMTSGPGQTGDGTVGVTPSVVSGTKSSQFASSCPS